MTEDEIKAELLIINTAIRNIMLVGQEYTTGSGASTRTFKAADIDKLRKYRQSLNRELREVTGCSGVVVGY
jgi:hypothetical protein